MRPATIHSLDVRQLAAQRSVLVQRPGDRGLPCGRRVGSPPVILLAAALPAQPRHTTGWLLRPQQLWPIPTCHHSHANHNSQSYEVMDKRVKLELRGQDPGKVRDSSERWLGELPDFLSSTNTKRWKPWMFHIFLLREGTQWIW